MQDAADAFAVAEYEDMHLAALQIQRLWRGHRGRHNAQRHRETWSRVETRLEHLASGEEAERSIIEAQEVACALCLGHSCVALRDLTWGLC